MSMRERGENVVVVVFVETDRQHELNSCSDLVEDWDMALGALGERTATRDPPGTAGRSPQWLHLAHRQLTDQASAQRF